MSTETTELRADALSLTGVLMQAITHIGPAVGFIFAIATTTGTAGMASPAVFVGAFLVVLLVAVSVTQLARHLPSAGGYFAWISHTVHPRAGFLIAWMMFIYEPIGAGCNLSFMGAYVESSLHREYGIEIHWWITVAVSAALLGLLSWFGVSVGIRMTVFLGAAEILIVLALAVSGLVHPGPGGVSLEPLDPSRGHGLNALYLAIVFSVFSFTGFEGVAPMAEETRDPRRNVPRAIYLSILITGLFFVLSALGTIIGWGTHDIAGFASDPAPVFTLGHRLWHGWWVILLVALVNSVLAVGIATSNASTRMLFAMGRVGALPRALGQVHDRHRTPSNAILLQTLLTLLVGIGGGVLLGPSGNLTFWALVITLVLSLVYVAGNIGAFRLYRGEYRHEFNLMLHVILPALATAALAWVAYKSVIPLPSNSAKWAPALVGAWLLAGVVITFVTSRGEQGWIARAGRAHQVMSDESAQPQEAS